MKRFAIFLIIVLLSSCVPRSTARELLTLTSTATELQPTFTSIPPTATFTAIPPTPTSTPEPCDPRKLDYCITDGHFVFQRPIRLPANTFIDPTYAYASTANRTRDPHHGVEFLNKFGTPVFAAGDGVVIFAGPDDEAMYSRWPNFYGNLIVIRHAEDLYTLYAHLSKIEVQVDQSIASGQKIGEVGQTGVAVGPHLHFEVRQGAAQSYFATQNPELWLVPNVDETGQPMGTIQISIAHESGQLVNSAEVTIQRHNDQYQPIGNTLYRVTYDKSMLRGEENAGMGDLPAGKYRLVMQSAGQLRERWVEVQSGKLTQVVFIIK